MPDDERLGGTRSSAGDSNGYGRRHRRAEEQPEKPRRRRRSMEDGGGGLSVADLVQRHGISRPDLSPVNPDTQHAPGQHGRPAESAGGPQWPDYGSRGYEGPEPSARSGHRSVPGYPDDRAPDDYAPGFGAGPGHEGYGRGEPPGAGMPDDFGHGRNGMPDGGFGPGPGGLPDDGFGPAPGGMGNGFGPGAPGRGMPEESFGDSGYGDSGDGGYGDGGYGPGAAPGRGLPDDGFGPGGMPGRGDDAFGPGAAAGRIVPGRGMPDNGYGPGPGGIPDDDFGPGTPGRGMPGGFGPGGMPDNGFGPGPGGAPDDNFGPGGGPGRGRPEGGFGPGPGGVPESFGPGTPGRGMPDNGFGPAPGGMPDDNFGPGAAPGRGAPDEGFGPGRRQVPGPGQASGSFAVPPGAGRGLPPGQGTGRRPIPPGGFGPGADEGFGDFGPGAAPRPDAGGFGPGQNTGGPVLPGPGQGTGRRPIPPGGFGQGSGPRPVPGPGQNTGGPVPLPGQGTGGPVPPPGQGTGRRPIPPEGFGPGQASGYRAVPPPGAPNRDQTLNPPPGRDQPSGPINQPSGALNRDQVLNQPSGALNRDQVLNQPSGALNRDQVLNQPPGRPEPEDQTTALPPTRADGDERPGRTARPGERADGAVPLPPPRKPADAISMTTEMEAIGEEVQKRRGIDHTLMRFSAVHDEIQAEERERKAKRRKLRPWRRDDDEMDKLDELVAGQTLAVQVPGAQAGPAADEFVEIAPDDGAEGDGRTRLQEKKARRLDRSTLAIRVAAATAAILVFVATGIAWGFKSWVDASSQQVDALDPNSKDIQDAAKQRGDENFLLVGSDTRAGASAEDGVGNEKQIVGARSDTVMVAHIPAGRERAVVVSFPRDLEVRRPACEGWDPKSGNYTGEQKPAAEQVKLNTAYQVGGPKCVTKLVQQMSGLMINHFVGIDFHGFKGMVDAVRGVQVCVEKPLKDDVLGTVVPQAGENVTLTGDQALNFVRARHVQGDVTSDYGRIIRQQRFLSSLLRKAMSSEVLLDPGKLSDFVQAFSKSTFGDNIGIDQMITLGQSLQGIQAGKVTFITVPTVGEANDRGNEDLRVDDTKSLFRAVREDTPLPGEKSGTQQLQAAVKTAPAPVDPKSIKLQVFNGGNPTGGIAGGTADQLAEFGYQIVWVDAAPEPVKNTIIKYGKGNEAKARLLQTSVPDADLVEDPSLAGAIQLVIGPGFDGNIVAPGKGKPADPLPPDLSTVNGGDVSCV